MQVDGILSWGSLVDLALTQKIESSGTPLDPQATGIRSSQVARAAQALGPAGIGRQGRQCKLEVQMTGILSSKVWHWKIFLTLILIPYRLILAGSGVLLTTTATTPPNSVPTAAKMKLRRTLNFHSLRKGVCKPRIQSQFPHHSLLPIHDMREKQLTHAPPLP